MYLVESLLMQAVS